MRRTWTACAAAVLALLCALVVARSLPGLAQTRPAGRHRPAVDGGVGDAAPADGAAPDAAPDGGTGAAAADGGAADAESDRERESWRVEPDLVNPFSDDYDDEIRRNQGGDDEHARPVHPRSWYLVEEDLVDPWNRARRPTHADEGADAADAQAGPETASRLGAPHERGRRNAPTAQERLSRTGGVEAELLVGAATLASGDARPRLDAELVWRMGTFLLGLDVLVSGGSVSGLAADDVHVFPVRRVYGREGALLSFGHRLTDGTLAVDLSLDAGVILSVLSTTEVFPFLRAAATGSLRVTRGVALLARVDVGTSFVAPSEFVAGGPGSFELGISLGVRLGGE